MADFEIFTWDDYRVYMVDFGRAKTGAPHRRFPEIDDTGYHDEAFPNEHGPITSAMAGQTGVTVLFHRTEISQKAKLFAVSFDPGVVQITKPAKGQLTADRSQIIQFTAGAATGRTAIEIRYNWEDGPVLGRLYVQVYERIQVRMRLHIVTIILRDAAGNIVSRADPPDPFFGKSCPTRAAKVARVKELLDGANEIWVPHGIVFAIDDVFDTEWGRNELDTRSTLPLSSMDLAQPGALSPNRSAAHVNVYCVPQITDAAGMAIDPVAAAKLGLLFPFRPATAVPQHNPGALFLSSATVLSVEQTIAHEMGHYMTLCASTDVKHSSGDLKSGPEAIRDDSVTRRRLLYPINGLLDAAPFNWRNDTGYGDKVVGGYITHRRLPSTQDITFEESNRARAATLAPGFYAP